MDSGSLDAVQSLNIKRSSSSGQVSPDQAQGTRNLLSLAACLKSLTDSMPSGNDVMEAPKDENAPESSNTKPGTSLPEMKSPADLAKDTAHLRNVATALPVFQRGNNAPAGSSAPKTPYETFTDSFHFFTVSDVLREPTTEGHEMVPAFANFSDLPKDVQERVSNIATQLHHALVDFQKGLTEREPTVFAAATPEAAPSATAANESSTPNGSFYELFHNMTLMTEAVEDSQITTGNEMVFSSDASFKLNDSLATSAKNLYAEGKKQYIKWEKNQHRSIWERIFGDIAKVIYLALNPEAIVLFAASAVLKYEEKSHNVHMVNFLVEKCHIPRVLAIAIVAKASIMAGALTGGASAEVAGAVKKLAGVEKDLSAIVKDVGAIKNAVGNVEVEMQEIGSMVNGIAEDPEAEDIIDEAEEAIVNNPAETKGALQRAKDFLVEMKENNPLRGRPTASMALMGAVMGLIQSKAFLNLADMAKGDGKIVAQVFAELLNLTAGLTVFMASSFALAEINSYNNATVMEMIHIAQLAGTALECFSAGSQSWTYSDMAIEQKALQVYNLVSNAQMDALNNGINPSFQSAMQAEANNYRGETAEISMLLQGTSKMGNALQLVGNA